MIDDGGVERIVYPVKDKKADFGPFQLKAKTSFAKSSFPSPFSLPKHIFTLLTFIKAKKLKSQVDKQSQTPS